MRKEYYQFKEEDAYSFAKHVGAKKMIRGTEMFFQHCPYCRANDKNTFSINLQTGQFQCKRASCGAKGNMITLSQDFGFSLGNDVDAYYNKKTTKKFVTYKPLGDYKPSENAVSYLQSRGISQATADKFRITTRKDNPNILCFPFLDEAGKVRCIKYRKTDFVKGKDKAKEWFESDNKPILFGEFQSDAVKNKRLVITEGQIDSLSLAEAGIENAVSVPNGCQAFTWIPNSWNFVCKFEEIVVFGDCENGKITLADRIKETFSRTAIIKAIRIKDYQGCKDANEILQKFGKTALVEAVENAENITISDIVSMSNVQSLDLDKLESFKTSFQQIDNALGHGIPFGSLVILTGKRGDGKSTFASQILAEALNQDYKCFIYSGELPNYTVKAWLDRQLSGMRTLNNNVIEKLNNWYRDKAFIFDNSMLDNEPSHVENVVEQAILRYGCRVIVIDNLMTALHGSTSDSVFHDQGAFVRKMAMTSKRYGVAIILVAHPKKGEVLDPDAISGSADIANAADIIMSYERIKDAPQECRGVSLMKNRYNNGRILVKDNAVRVKYSTESMRIVEENDDFNKDYGWRTVDTSGFIDAEDFTDIPWEVNNENKA